MDDVFVPLLIEQNDFEVSGGCGNEDRWIMCGCNDDPPCD